MTAKEILSHSGTVSHDKAMKKAREEYLVYKEKTKNELSRVEEDFLKQIDSTAKVLKEKR